MYINHSAGSYWPVYSNGSYHGGTDFGVALNSPVYSTCDGEVVAVTSLTYSYGKHIKIKAIVNGGTVYIRYCHLNSFAVSVGDKVRAGQLIARSGSTGKSTGPHLHYEVRNANDYYGYDASHTNLNPRNYLPGSGYTFETNGPTEKPSNVSLSKSQYWYDIKDTITLYPHADNATSYWLSVYKDNNHIVDQAINGEFSFQADQWGYGDYYAWITASNSCGSTDSEGINFTVCGAPSYNGISTSKAVYDWDENDTVEISVNSVCSKGQVIGIDSLDDNLNYVKRVITDGSDTTYRISAKSLGIGYFSAYFSVYNGSGSIDTKSVKFYIGQKKNLGDDFYAKIKNNSSNKYLTVVDNNVEGKDNTDDYSQVWNFNELSDGSYKIKKYNDNKALDVDNYASAGAGSNVHIYNDWDSNAQKFYIYELCGAYYIKPQCTDMVLDMSQSTYNLEVWGSGFDWSPQKFSIEKLSPGNPQISLNKTKFILGENITVNASADYSVQYYTVQIYKQDKSVYTKDFTGHTINIPSSVLGNGDYTVFVSCTNSSGTTTTEKVNFAVVDNVTTTTVQPTTVTTKPTTETKPTTVTTTTKPTTVTTNPTTATKPLENTTVNNVNVGDTVTVDYYVKSDCIWEDFSGHIKYDYDGLQLESFDMHGIEQGIMYNTSIKGYVYYTGVDIRNNYKFINEVKFYRAKFKLLKACNYKIENQWETVDGVDVGEIVNKGVIIQPEKIEKISDT